MAGLSRVEQMRRLEKRGNLLYDFRARFSSFLVDEINHFGQLATGFFHLQIIEVLVGPDVADLVYHSGPAVVHVLGCHGKT